MACNNTGFNNDVPCGGNCLVKCELEVGCINNKDCKNLNCDDKLCDVEIAHMIIVPGAIIMCVTAVLFFLCCLWDCRKSYVKRKAIRQRQKQKMRAKSSFAGDATAIALKQPGDESQILVHAMDELKTLKSRVTAILRRSRRIMSHPGKQMMNIEIEEYKDIRDFDIWCFRLIACALVEHSFRPINTEILGERMKIINEIVVEMEKIGDMMLKAFNLQGRGDDNAGAEFRFIRAKLEKCASEVPAIIVNHYVIPKRKNEKKNLAQVAAIMRDNVKKVGNLTNIYLIKDILEKGHLDKFWGFYGPLFKASERRSRGLLDRFSQSPEAKAAFAKFAGGGGLIQRFKSHPFFYGTLLFFYMFIFFSMAGKVERSAKALRQNRDAILEDHPLDDQPIDVGENAPLGGFGVTFLSIPPAYNLEQDTLQAVFIPIVYGVMHCGLFTLGLLPVCFYRGIWRDVVHFFPGIRMVIPVDDFEWLHRQLGIMILFFVGSGGLIWMLVMGVFRCLNVKKADASDVDFQACAAFDQGFESQDLINPIINVVMLRVLVWATWFTLIPLMKIGKDAPPFFCLPIVKKYWYEICYRIHIFTALFTVALALAARFQVFYPMLCTWPLYVLDWAREALFHTKKLRFSPKDSVWHSSSKDGKPTTMQLRFRVPEKEGMVASLRSSLPVKAGMWLYLQIPEIDSVWHPFSITNKAADDFLELDIGIRGNLEPVKGDEDVDFPWYMPKSKETWTYQLWVRMRNTRNDRDEDTSSFPVYVRGPYGAAFVSCFDPAHAGSVVIGAGTGVTAAQSVLKEFIWRKQHHRPLPPFCFFVWSCQRVDDLLWVFPALREEISIAVEHKVLDENSITPNSSMLDWISITCYVSRSDKEGIATFQSWMENEKRKARNQTDIRVLEWLADQVVWGASMDDKKTHIGKLLFGIRDKLRDAEYGDRMSICYCGPTGLASLIGAAASSLAPAHGKNTIEFTADAQG